MKNDSFLSSFVLHFLVSFYFNSYPRGLKQIINMTHSSLYWIFTRLNNILTPTLGLSWALATEQPTLYFFVSMRLCFKLAVCCVFLFKVDFQTLIWICFQTRKSSTTSSGFTCLIFNLFIYMHFSSVISEFAKPIFVKLTYILSRHFRKAFLAYFSFIVCF